MKSINYKKILILGAGEIGSRHLQSMARCALPLKIYVHSNNVQSLKVCEDRWLEVASTSSLHQLIMCANLENLPVQIDLVIASSTASSRPELIEGIANKTQVTFWVLEKVLAQSSGKIKAMMENVSLSSQSWVNYYMLADPWYAEIKRHLLPFTLKRMEVIGGDWGLACNSLHFIHLHAWFSDSRLASLNVENLSTKWHASKRVGNWEIFGEMSAEFSDGGGMKLSAKPGPALYSIFLRDGPFTWEIDEPSGLARRSDGLEIRGRVPYQSERKLAEEILTNGFCQLPTFSEVIPTDQLFMDTMLGHWQRWRDPQALSVPIT